MRISDWSSDVCSSDLAVRHPTRVRRRQGVDHHPVALEADADLAPVRGRRLLQRDPRRHGRTERPRSRAAGTSTEPPVRRVLQEGRPRSEEHTSELQSLMRISYAVFCLTKKRKVSLVDTVILRQHDINTLSV